MRQGVFVIALVCALAPAARGDNKQAAKEAYTEGKRHYDLGEYDAALAAFKKAYLNYEEPVFLFNIAQCYRQLGDRPAAVRTYRVFLQNWPKAPNRARVEEIIAELESAMAQDQVAKAAPPKETMEPRPPVKPEVATSEPKPTQPPVESKPAESKPSTPTATTTPKPEPAKVATKPTTRPSRADYTEMEEVTPNFDRPSGAGTQVYKKWWFWTVLGVAIAGVAAAAVAVPLTTGKSSFNPTLPDYTANNGLRILAVPF